MVHLVQHLLSGGLSGLATTICLQPFDLLKTRVQQGDGSLRSRNTTLVIRTAQEIVSNRGFNGLWRGTNASLMRNVPGVALYMTCLTQLRTFMATSSTFSRVLAEKQHTSGSVLPSLTSQGNLLAGVTARIAVGFLLNPLSVLKARYESNMYTYQSLGVALVSIARLGPPELLRGFVASSLRDAPYAGLFVVFYEGIKLESASVFPHVHSTAVHGFSAAGAGAIATLTTHPFDVIKTKVQVRSEERYQGFFRTVRTIWTQRGVSGFFDGTSLRMSRKVLSSAICWAVYEGVLMAMRTRD